MSTAILESDKEEKLKKEKWTKQWKLSQKICKESKKEFTLFWDSSNKGTYRKNKGA